MKILFVNVFYPPQLVGGATRVMHDNIALLQKYHGSDYSLRVITTDLHDTGAGRTVCYDEEGLRVYRLGVKFRIDMDWLYEDEEIYSEVCRILEYERPDLVHVHCVQRMTASVLQAIIDRHLPVLVTAHDAWWISDYQFLVDKNGRVYPDGHPDNEIDPTGLPDYVTVDMSLQRRQHLKSLLSRTTGILTVSKRFADIYRLNGIKDIDVIGNGVSDTVDWKEKDTSHTQRVVCAQIGGMTAHKGYTLITQALEEIATNHIEFLFVDHSRPPNHNHETSIGNTPVRYIGYMPQQNIAQLYSRIDVLFAPSIWPESFGLVTREALMCRCWVVASDIGAIGEDVIPDQNGFIVPANDLQSLKETLLAIDSGYEKYKNLAAETPIRTVSEQVRELDTLYKSLLKQP